MIPLSFPKGCVVNFYGEHPKNLLMRFVYGQIRRYQKRKYPHSSRTDAIHTMLHLGEGRFLSVESPRAVIREREPEGKFSVWRYKYDGNFTEESWRAFEAAVKEIAGTPYDYGQLVDILVHQLFGWLPEKLNLFDFGRKRKVCSVAAHAVLVKAWQQTDRSQPRPLGNQYIEHTCPADFENDQTFEEITTSSAPRTSSPSTPAGMPPTRRSPCPP